MTKATSDKGAAVFVDPHEDFSRHPMRLLRIKQVIELVSLSPTTIWFMTAKGEFPQPIKLGNRATAWQLGDIMAWIEARKNQSQERREKQLVGEFVRGLSHA
jgi:prophage regulatory protein